MRIAPIDLYAYAPYHIKVCLASIQGLRLRRLRFGSNTESLVQQAHAREFWPLKSWNGYVLTELERILEKALSTVPYYRSLSISQHRYFDPTFPRDLRQLLAEFPVLKKPQARALGTQLVSDRSDFSALISEHTSGSTGTPLTFWNTRESVRSWYALFEARWRRWYGLSRTDPWAIIGGRMVTPLSRSKPPFWVWNKGLNQLYLSAYHITLDNAEAYMSAMRSHRVQYLLAYPSALVGLSRFILEAQIPVPNLKLIIGNAEPFTPAQREFVERAFRAPTKNTYGMSEMVCAASECEHGRMHLWPEAGVYEVLKDDSDSPVAPGEPGRLVCTGLLNDAMPLIRYETGDRVAIEPESAVCPCGRTMPILKSVEGRIDDMVRTPEGRLVGRLDPVFKRTLPIVEAQIVQDSLNHLVVNIVPAPGFDRSTEAYLREALRDRVGPMGIDFVRMERIPRGPNGKFRGVISMVRRDIEPNAG